MSLELLKLELSIGKRLWLVISTIISKLKDFLRSQPVTYTANVVIFRKRALIVDDIGPIK